MHADHYLEIKYSILPKTDEVRRGYLYRMEMNGDCIIIDASGTIRPYRAGTVYIIALTPDIIAQMATVE